MATQRMKYCNECGAEIGLSSDREPESCGKSKCNIELTRSLRTAHEDAKWERGDYDPQGTY